MIIHLIAAARPNFMKVAPLFHALKKEKWAEVVLVHTGQHYDINMSDVFFQDLGVPNPDIHLGVGSGTHAEQTGQVMIGYERVLLNSRPDLVVVVGDVNSTMAATLAAVKLGVRVAHLEAGLRSFDRTMPEEINRIVTDSLADILFTPSPDADDNLLREGVQSKRIHRVGNIMIDSLEMLRKRIESQGVFEELGLTRQEYGVITLHRPSNVDDFPKLAALCRQLTDVARRLPLVFPVHPRTHKSLNSSGLMSDLKKEEGLILLEPLSYVRFMNLVFNCRFAVTDSGGIQEETTYLGIPCLTVRPNTERPITISKGTNRLCDLHEIEERVRGILNGNGAKARGIELWDGHAATRVMSYIYSSWY